MKTQTQERISYLYKPAAFLIGCILFSTISCVKEPDVEPKLNTLQASDADIGSTTAVLKGEILILGNLNIIEYGIEISKSQIFTPSTRKGYTTAPAAGIFQVDFTGLDPNTLYYYKAYVTINTAQVYSQIAAHFTTKQ
jgi:hypothetical protein